jgi:ferrous iron transport protein B
MKVALAGNPNVGKSVIFNALTGSHQHVANFPGCTVEHKEGKCVFCDSELIVLDLPGTYSLSAYSEDERVTRRFLITDKPDLVVNVIDASNLERNLFLTVQLLELGLPIIIVLNMLDVAELKGFELDIKELEKKLKVPVVPMIATKGKGIVELLDIILSYDITKKEAQIGFTSSQKIIKKYESEIANIISEIDRNDQLKKFDYNWLGLKVLEQDQIILDLIDQILLEQAENISQEDNPSWKQINQILNSFKVNTTSGDTAVFIANERYKVVSNIIENVIIKEGKASGKVTSMLDEVLTDKYLGIPIFLASLWALFTFTFTLSEPFVLILEAFFTLLVDFINYYVPEPNIAGLLVGILNGLGAIAVFIPNIFLLYFGMAIIEDSGWLARAAFVADKWLEKIGLHGKSFIPLMLGFGCTVPAIMATRAIRNKEDRMITLAITPFISCAARLPVYVLFAGIFFPDFAALAILMMYIIGIVVAVAVALVLNAFFYKHEDHTFIMELPEFQTPQLRTAVREMWLQGSMFIKRAGKIIFLASLFVWFLSSLPLGVSIDNTYLAMVGKALEPLFFPFNWTWEFISALILGLIAKEVIVATLGILGGLSLTQFIGGAITMGQALPFMVFVLLYTPCFATIAIIKSETGSWKITFILGIGYIIVAYGVALVFRLGLLALGIA